MREPGQSCGEGKTARDVIALLEPGTWFPARQLPAILLETAAFKAVQATASLVLLAGHSCSSYSRHGQWALMADDATETGPPCELNWLWRYPLCHWRCSPLVARFCTCSRAGGPGMLLGSCQGARKVEGLLIKR